MGDLPPAPQFSAEDYLRFKNFPVPQELKDHLTRNLINLIEHISDRLFIIISYMGSNDALVLYLRQSIMAERTPMEQVSTLVDIVRGSSAHDYVRFLEAISSAKLHQLTPFFLEVLGKSYRLDANTVLTL